MNASRSDKIIWQRGKAYNKDRVCLIAATVFMGWDGCHWVEARFTEYSVTLHGTKFLCGDVTLTADTHSAPESAVVTCIGCLAAS